MHANYQGLARDPFPNKPSPEVFFDSSVHRAAWTFLRGALRGGEPLIMLTGDFGTGKTLMALKLVAALSAKNLAPCVYISTPSQSYLEVLLRACRALGIALPEQPLDPDYLLDRIHTHLDTEASGRRLFLVVEDPQEMDADKFDKIRLLPNYNTDGHFPICLILFAHTDFPRTLDQPRWAAFDQRIKLRHHLTGFDRAETREYIYFRLLRAQGRSIDPFSPYFEEPAIDLIQDLTGGVPRNINNLCGACLDLGGPRRIIAIGPDLVEEAAQGLGWLEGQAGAAPAHDTTAAPAAPADPAHDPAAGPDPQGWGTSYEEPAAQTGWGPPTDPEPAPAWGPPPQEPAPSWGEQPPQSQPYPYPQQQQPPQPDAGWSAPGALAPGGYGGQAPYAGYAPQQQPAAGYPQGYPDQGGYGSTPAEAAPGGWTAAPQAPHPSAGYAGGDDGLGDDDGARRGRGRRRGQDADDPPDNNRLWWAVVIVFIVLIVGAVIVRNVDLAALFG